jgi:hypothetical protein
MRALPPAVSPLAHLSPASWLAVGSRSPPEATSSAVRRIEASSILACPTGLVECLLDPFVGDVLLTVDAVGVHRQHHRHAVACPSGDFSSGNASIEPEGNRGMSQVIRSTGQRRGDLSGSQGPSPGRAAKLSRMSSPGVARLARCRTPSRQGPSQTRPGVPTELESAPVGWGHSESHFAHVA